MELEFKEPSEKPTEAYHKYRSFLRELEKHPDRWAVARRMPRTGDRRTDLQRAYCQLAHRRRRYPLVQWTHSLEEDAVLILALVPKENVGRGITNPPATT